MTDRPCYINFVKYLKNVCMVYKITFVQQINHRREGYMVHIRFKE